MDAQQSTTSRTEIKYDRESRDFAMYLDGELIGYARNYHEAEITLSDLLLTQAQHGVA